jgi:hypothetical protein
VKHASLSAVVHTFVPGVVSTFVLAAVAILGACALPTSPERDAADVRGEWSFSALQTAPSVTIEGVLRIERQDGDLIIGTASWTERDALGITQLGGGSVTGRVIGEADVDFDILVGATPRRHVARLAADTMAGSWVQPGSTSSGTWRAVRGATGGPGGSGGAP